MSDQNMDTKPHGKMLEDGIKHLGKEIGFIEHVKRRRERWGGVRENISNAI